MVRLDFERRYKCAAAMRIREKSKERERKLEQRARLLARALRLHIIYVPAAVANAMCVMCVLFHVPALSALA